MCATLFASISHARRLAFKLLLWLSCFLAVGSTAWAQSGKIAFSSTHLDFNREIYVMNADGTGKQRLTYHLDDDTMPVLNPGGTKVAFLSNRASKMGFNELFVVNVDGTGLQQLTTAGKSFTDVAWSPDGTKLALSGNLNAEYGLFVIEAAGGALAKILDYQVSSRIQWVNFSGVGRISFVGQPPGGSSNAYTCLPDGSSVQLAPRSGGCYSQDGTLLARWGGKDPFSQGSNSTIGGVSIIRVSDGAYLFEVKSATIFADAGTPIAFSPDNQFVTFIGSSSNRYELYRAAVAADSIPQPLTFTPAREASPSWALGSTVPVTPPSRGQGRLLFGSHHSLFSTNAAGWDVIRVATGTGANQVRQPGWAGDGSRITYQTADGVYTAAPDGSDARLIAANTSNTVNTYPTLSPDGSHLAYSGYKGPGDPFLNIYTRSALVQASPIATEFEGDFYTYTNTHWSRGALNQRLATIRYRQDEGQRLMIGTPQDGFASGTIIVASTADSTNSFGFNYPRWRPDRNSLVLVDNRTRAVAGVGIKSRLNLATLDPDGGNYQAITDYPETDQTAQYGNGPKYLYHPSYSPDGQQIAFIRTTDGIMFINANGTGLTRFANLATSNGVGGEFNDSKGLDETAGLEWGPSNYATPADTTAPTLTISSPTSGSQTALRSITGTAQDAGSGVGIVWVSLRRTADGKFWNPTSAERWTTQRALLPTSLSESGSGQWSWVCQSLDKAGQLPKYVDLAAGSYEILAFAVDTAGLAGAEASTPVQVIKSGAVSFSSTVVEVNEATGLSTPTLSVVRTGGTEGTISVEYTFYSQGASTAGTDFTATTGTLTFTPGESSKTVPIPVLNDAEPEVSEPFYGKLQNPSALTELSAPHEAIINIADDDLGQFKLSGETTYRFTREDAGTYQIGVDRLGGTAAVTIQVQANYYNGGAAPFASISQSVTFQPGETHKDVPLTLTNNSSVDGVRTGSISIYNSTFGITASASLQVLDDETIAAQGDFAFSQASYATDGSGQATITITRTGASSGAVTVGVNSTYVAEDTAQQGTHFTLNRTSATFPAGSSAAQNFILSEKPVANLAGRKLHLQLSVDGAVIGIAAVTLTGASAPDLPEVTTGAVTLITQNGARLNGTVNPRGTAGTMRFEYGLTTAYGQLTPVQNTGAGQAATAFSATLTGLQAGTTYHYRAIAGEIVGSDASFTTAAAPVNPPPAGGLFSVSPRIEVAPGSSLEAVFASWKDKDLPLKYSVLLDGETVVSPGTALRSIITAPSTPGTYTVLGRVQDKLGHATEVSLPLTVVAAPASPTVTLLLKSGTTLPAGAGATGTWLSFGVPTALPSGQLGFLATYRDSQNKIVSAIFDGPDAAPVQRLRIADPVTDAAGATLSQGTFSTFKDPAFSGPNQFAVLANVAGVSGAENVGLWARVGGVLYNVARKGGTVQNVSGVKLGAIGSYAMDGETVFFTAKIVGPNISALKDDGLYVWTPTQGTRCLFLEHTNVAVAPGDIRKIASFQALGTRPSSQGEPAVESGHIPVRFVFNDGTQALYLARSPGILERVDLSKTGTPQRTVLNVLDLGTDADHEAYTATFADRTTGVLLDGEIIARSGVAAPGTSGSFKTFYLPVTGPGQGILDTAFLATAAGLGLSAASDGGIWYGHEERPLSLLAQEYTFAPGTGNARFSAFTGLALLPQRGPIFTAKLLAGTGNPRTTGASDLGLWSLSSTGALVKLLREGDSAGGQLITRFDALSTVLGSAGQRRTFAPDTGVVTRVYLGDRTHGLVRIVVP